MGNDHDFMKVGKTPLFNTVKEITDNLPSE